MIEYIKTDDYDYEYAGCHHDSLIDMVHSGVLEFCSCGSPRENLAYLLGGLELIDEVAPNDDPGTGGVNWSTWYKEHRARVDAHFKDPAAKYFFYYWADKEDYIEHGTGLPGWLTDKGKDLLEILKKCKEEEDY